MHKEQSQIQTHNCVTVELLLLQLCCNFFMPSDFCACRRLKNDSWWALDRAILWHEEETTYWYQCESLY